MDFPKTRWLLRQDEHILSVCSGSVEGFTGDGLQVWFGLDSMAFCGSLRSDWNRSLIRGFNSKQTLVSTVGVACLHL